MIRGILWSWLPWLYNKTMNTIDVIKRIAKAAHNEIMIDKEWLILKNQVPVYSLLFPEVPVATIKWSCKTNPPRFYDTNSSIIDSKHISHLGFVVKLSGYDPIDLTEWINTVQWTGVTEPSLLDLFTLWCCETGHSYFHLTSIASVDLITEMGDSLTKGLNDSVIHNTSDGRYSREYTGGETNRLDSVRVLDTILSSGGC